MSEKNEEPEKFEGKLPDAIYVDDVHQYEKRQGFSGKMEYFEKIQKIEKGGYPFFLRIVTALGGTLIFVWSFFLAAFAAFITLLAAVCFFASDELNQNMRNLWKMFGRMCVFSLSLIIATFAPAFGFGMIALYMMMNGENVEASFMSRILKGRFTLDP